MGTPKIDPKDLKWDVVEEAAKRILAHVDSANFAPPEGQQIWVNEVCRQMNKIAEALCFTAMK